MRISIVYINYILYYYILYFFFLIPSNDIAYAPACISWSEDDEADATQNATKYIHIYMSIYIYTRLTTLHDNNLYFIYNQMSDARCCSSRSQMAYRHVFVFEKLEFLNHTTLFGQWRPQS